MVSLFAFLLATQVPIEQPPRLRTLLPNGAVVLVERVPTAQSLTVDLFVSAKGTEETPATHGRRHLLEHLVALGVKGDLDRRIETVGGLLRARTYRDSMAFELSLPPSELKLGLSALQEILTGPKIDAPAIAKEAEIMGEEEALRDSTTQASDSAWSGAFGERGLDPFGSLDTMRATTPEELESLRKRMFSAGNLAVVVSGNVDLDEATQMVRDTVAFVPVVKNLVAAPAPTPERTVVTVHRDGEFRAVAVPGYRSPGTAAALAAAFALASQLEGAEVMYTPSGRPGLVTLGVPHGALLLDSAQSAELFATGKQMASRWVRLRLSDPASSASFRGMLIVQERDLRPEILLENLDVMTFEEFDRAFRKFKNGEAGR